jgi:hypothetical protein
MADTDNFRAMMDTLKDSARANLDNPARATEVFGDLAGLQKVERTMVANNMLKSGDPTVWGLTNALTRTAQDLDYERKHELETFAGKLLEDQRMWKPIVNAA